ncbi:hypothetical protein [Kordiimonas aestuarii]|uniref:hypothetical protein n=1 Tax=Kordiimonas aestuarii TaxID=1005925 RepID=UPI0021D3898B|nr:hypothetical protein [Kordiimonas aestuarii]
MKDKIEAAVTRIFALTRVPWVRRVAMVLASVLFLGGFYISAQEINGDVAVHSWPALALVCLVIVPALILLNGAEMKLAAAMVGVSIGFWRALGISVQASAANMLPLPAGPMLRVGAVMTRGASLARGSLSVLLPAFVWLAIGLLISAAAGYGVGAHKAASALLLLGAGVAVLVAIMAVRTGVEGKALSVLVVIKFVTGLLDALALYILFQVIGVAASVLQTGMLAASAPLGAAVAVVPGGLGVRELASSGLGVMAGLSAASAFLVPSLLRLAFLLVLMPLALVFALITPSND